MKYLVVLYKYHFNGSYYKTGKITITFDYMFINKLANGLEEDDIIIKTILKNVVTLENKQQFCDFLKGLSHGLNNSSRRYFGSSILLIKGPKKSEIRWVDFHYWCN